MWRMVCLGSAFAIPPAAPQHRKLRVAQVAATPQHMPAQCQISVGLAADLSSAYFRDPQQALKHCQRTLQWSKVRARVFGWLCTDRLTCVVLLQPSVSFDHLQSNRQVQEIRLISHHMGGLLLSWVEWPVRTTTGPVGQAVQRPLRSLRNQKGSAWVSYFCRPLKDS